MDFLRSRQHSRRISLSVRVLFKKKLFFIGIGNFLKKSLTKGVLSYKRGGIFHNPEIEEIFTISHMEGGDHCGKDLGKAQGGAEGKSLGSAENSFQRGVIMKSRYIMGIIGFIFVVGLLLPSTAPAVDKVVLGHPAALSGKFAKSGAQCAWGIKGSIKWINEVRGGINIGGKKVPLDYKVYDCESRKE